MLTVGSFDCSLMARTCYFVFQWDVFLCRGNTFKHRCGLEYAIIEFDRNSVFVLFGVFAILGTEIKQCNIWVN